MSKQTLIGKRTEYWANRMAGRQPTSTIPPSELREQQQQRDEEPLWATSQQDELLIPSRAPAISNSAATMVSHSPSHSEKAAAPVNSFAHSTAPVAAVTDAAVDHNSVADDDGSSVNPQTRQGPTAPSCSDITTVPGGNAAPGAHSDTRENREVASMIRRYEERLSAVAEQQVSALIQVVGGQSISLSSYMLLDIANCFWRSLVSCEESERDIILHFFKSELRHLTKLVPSSPSPPPPLAPGRSSAIHAPSGVAAKQVASQLNMSTAAEEGTMGQAFVEEDSEEPLQEEKGVVARPITPPSPPCSPPELPTTAERRTEKTDGATSQYVPFVTLGQLQPPGAASTGDTPPVNPPPAPGKEENTAAATELVVVVATPPEAAVVLAGPSGGHAAATPKPVQQRNAASVCTPANNPQGANQPAPAVSPAALPPPSSSSPPQPRPQKQSRFLQAAMMQRDW